MSLLRFSLKLFFTCFSSRLSKGDHIFKVTAHKEIRMHAIKVSNEKDSFVTLPLEIPE